MADLIWHLDATGIWWLQIHEQILAEIWLDHGNVWKGVVRVGTVKRGIWDDGLSNIKQYAEDMVRELLER